METEIAKATKRLDGRVEFWFNQAKNQLSQARAMAVYPFPREITVLLLEMERNVAVFRQYLLERGILDAETDLPKRVAESQRKEPPDAPI